MRAILVWQFRKKGVETIRVSSPPAPKWFVSDFPYVPLDTLPGMDTPVKARVIGFSLSGVVTLDIDLWGVREQVAVYLEDAT